MKSTYPSRTGNRYYPCDLLSARFAHAYNLRALRDAAWIASCFASPYLRARGVVSASARSRPYNGCVQRLCEPKPHCLCMCCSLLQERERLFFFAGDSSWL